MGELRKDDECFEPGFAAQGVDERLALLVYRSGVDVMTRGEAALAPLGISGRDYTVLAVLATDAPESQLDLARLLGVGAVSIVSTVDGLEGKGLVERRRSERDRRRSVVSLTTEGRRTLERADAIADAVIGELFAGVDADERAVLHAMLRRARAPRWRGSGDDQRTADAA
jgi:DNA-binding MarR family transcriptional regulator